MYCVAAEASDVIYRDGLENVSIRIPGRNYGDLVMLPEFPKPEAGFIESAFAAPVNSPSLRVLAGGKKRAAIMVSDSTRNVPTAEVLPRVLEELALGGMNMGGITLIVATGVHRPATEDELREIVGENFWGKVQIVNHNPYDRENLVSLGVTSRGTPVEINRLAAAADLRVVIGKVEPHEFAGFSGGRKSILPGISSEQSILVNHRPEMILDPMASIGILDGNPIHEDMAEAARMAGVHFSVNILAGLDGMPFHVNCGCVESSHAAAVTALKGYISLPLPHRLKIAVVTPGYPLNINLYQTIKAIIAMAPVMDKDGILVLYSNCTEGTDSPDMLRPFEERKGIDGALAFLHKNYKIQMDHSLLLCKILQKGLRVVFSSPNIDPDISAMMGFIPSESPEAAVEKALSMAGGEEKVTFMPCPQRALPFISQYDAASR